MDKEIIKIAKLYTKKVKARYPVKMVVLYGSHAKGTANELSDIDIAVIVDKVTGDYLKISADLFNLVRDVSNRIEPVLLSRANDKSGFLESVLRQGKIIYKAAN
ncbi:MAG: nucleotidyltransferase domain-containing protein [Smithella sp.]